jgi:Holliday junction resolvase
VPGNALYLIEVKYTDRKSYSLTKKTLEKIRKEAAGQNRIPIMRINIQGEEWYVVPNNIWGPYMEAEDDQ